MPYPISVADFKSSSEVTLPNYHPRDFWRVHGTSWRSLFELHAAIVNRLQANSSLWGSS